MEERNLQKLLSIIVPVYNAEKYLDRCITSLLNQSYTNFEVLLINDSSTDNSAMICQRYVQKDSRIRLLNKKNEGAGFARNYGIMHAHGDIIGFCDADDYQSPDMYEKMISLMVENDYDLVYCGNTNEKKIPKITGQVEAFVDEISIFRLMLGEVGTPPNIKEDTYYGSSVWRGIYKKKIIDENKIKFLSERKIGSEDLLFNLKFLSKCKSAAYLNDELYMHCDNDDSMTHSKEHFDIENEIRLFNEINIILSDTIKYDYKLEMYRFFIKRIRLAVISMSKAVKNGFLFYELNSIKKVLNNATVREVLKEYPGWKLPVKQSVMFYAMKYRMVFICFFLAKFV